MLILDSGNVFADKLLPEASLEPTLAKAKLILKTMDLMGYAAVAVGEKDLYLGLERLRLLSDLTKVKFLSANLIDSEGKTLFEPYRILKVGRFKVGVIGLTAFPSNSSVFSRRMPDVKVKDPEQAARQAVEEIRGKCDLVVLLSNIGLEKDIELGETIPGIDTIIGSGTKRYMRRPVIKGKTLITTGYYEGRAIGRLLMHLDGDIKGWISSQELDYLDRQIQIIESKVETPLVKKRHDTLLEKKEALSIRTVYEPDMVNLEPSFQDDPQIAAMITEYRKELSNTPAGGTEVVTAQVNLVRYTGALACAKCHESRYRFWITTGHSKAFDTLVTKDSTADPDCVPCHVTGNERPMGYQINAPKDFLKGVQCESCHGIGSLHAAAPDRYSLNHLPTAPLCMDCHTEDRDDDFDYFRDRVLVCAEL